MEQIHKPADRLVKDFADEAARIFLHIMGVVRLDEDARIKPLRQETAPPVRLPDWVATLRRPGRKLVTLHIEFLLNYVWTTPRTMARYGGSLAWQYNRPVVSLLLLLRNKGVPKEVPEIGECKIGETRTTHPYRVVRMRDLDPTLIIESKNPRLFPWAVLMKSTDEQVRWIGRELARDGDEESMGRFIMTASFRYDRDVVTGMLGGANMGLVEALKEGSWIFTEARDEGMAKGLAEGRAEGEAKGIAEGKAEGKAEGELENSRTLFRKYLKSKLPGLETMPEIEAIGNSAALEALLDELVLASAGRVRMRRAILDAAKKA